LSEPPQYPPRLAARDISFEILAYNVLLFSYNKEINEKLPLERPFSLRSENEFIFFDDLHS
jgi:hypothetical protein